MLSFLSDGLFLLVKVSNMKECRQKQAYSGWWDNLIFATLNFCLCMPGMYYMCTYEMYSVHYVYRQRSLNSSPTAAIA